MERLTNENGLIKGNFDYQAVKEAVEKLYVLEKLALKRKRKYRKNRKIFRFR